MVGNSGSGKTTVARRLARTLAVPHVELDALYHQPGWRELPEPEFRQAVATAVAGQGWVVDGNYSQVLDLVRARADTVVWLDLPRPVVMRQVVARTLARGLLRRELWNGNRESLRWALSRDPYRSIIAWSWTRHGVYRQRYERLVGDPEWAHVDAVRLCSRAQVRSFLSAAGGH